MYFHYQYGFIFNEKMVDPDQLGYLDLSCFQKRVIELFLIFFFFFFEKSKCTYLVEHS